MEKIKDRLLNVEQVKTMLKCSRSHVYNLISMGELSAFRIGERNGVRVKKSILEGFIKKREQVEGM